jgi:5-hydroxyisourate hydrolase-like protein (transthyretin family)
MAVTSKTLYRGAAATSTATLYTVPTTSTTTVVTNVVVTNSAASAGTFTLTLDGTDIFTTTAIAANTTAMFDMKQVLAANATPKIIAGFASAVTVKFHISGVEVA